jgi:hypothetical protein
VETQPYAPKSRSKLLSVGATRKKKNYINTVAVGPFPVQEVLSNVFQNLILNRKKPKGLIDDSQRRAK